MSQSKSPPVWCLCANSVQSFSFLLNDRESMSLSLVVGKSAEQSGKAVTFTQSYN